MYCSSAETSKAHCSSVPMVTRRNCSMRGALKWRTMMCLLRSQADNSAASCYGSRMKMKFAAEGRTSKPSAFTFSTKETRVAITAARILSK